LEDVTSSQRLAAGNPEDERYALIQRVVSSQPFARAPQLRGFLLFVAERALAGRVHEINEHEIGRAVLGRRPTFNPHEENNVRAQARYLRAKLEQYFENDGKDEPVVVTIPRGTYVPVFEPRAAVPAPPDMPALPPAPRAWTSVRMRSGLVLLAVL